MDAGDSARPRAMAGDRCGFPRRHSGARTCPVLCPYLAGRVGRRTDL